MKIVCVVGTRPNFIKIAPLMEAFASEAAISPVLAHTGQHYDDQMAGLFFRQLGIPHSDIHLGVGSASDAVQTSRIMMAFEPVLMRHTPDAVLVVGDVNSTIACAMVAAKLGVTLVHVEAGLRSFDRTMPEEINRLLTDTISDLLFCTEQSGVDNLRHEGVAEEKIFLVGNVMVDTLLATYDKADASTILDDLQLDLGNYAVLTLHRPANVDDNIVFDGLLDAVEVVQRDMPVIFPIHPRTGKNLEGSVMGTRVKQMSNLQLTTPLGYLDFIKLIASARFVLTDSGGIQEETTILKVPCLTLRDSTERPVTVVLGSNRVVGTAPDRIIAAYREVMDGKGQPIGTPPLWDGHAAERIAAILVEKIAVKGPR